MYFAVGMLGLLLAFGFGRAQIVWSSTGIAFAGLFIFGLRYWPAIAIADLLLSIAAGYGPVAASAISCGKVLEAVIGVALYQHYAGRRSSFRTVGDVLAFVAAAAIGCMIGGGIGTASMLLTKVEMHTSVVRVWGNWWFGDLLSDLVLAPFLINLYKAPWRHWSRRQMLEGFALLLVFIAAAVGVYTARFGDNLLIPYTFPLFPLMIWAALRFEQTGAATASLLISALALVTANRSTDVFSQEQFNQALFTVHSYMFVVAISSYCLGAAVTARRYAQEHARQLSDELRSLSQQLEVAREQERLHLAREVHDQLGQQLTGLGLSLASLQRKLPDDAQAAHEKTLEMEQILRESIDTVQRIATELRPGVVNDLSLPEALQWLAEKTACELSMPVTFRNDVTDTSDHPDHKVAVFRIFQEAFTNLARHSRATAAILQIATRDGRVVVSLQDDGVGLGDGAKTSPDSLGIIGMRERAHAFGAELRIEPSPFLGTPGRPGTMVEVTLPKS